MRRHLNLIVFILFLISWTLNMTNNILLKLPQYTIWVSAFGIAFAITGIVVSIMERW